MTNPGVQQITKAPENKDTDKARKNQFVCTLGRVCVYTCLSQSMPTSCLLCARVRAHRMSHILRMPRLVFIRFCMSIH